MILASNRKQQNKRENTKKTKEQKNGETNKEGRPLKRDQT
jgi:hypothetical protein